MSYRIAAFRGGRQNIKCIVSRICMAVVVVGVGVGMGRAYGDT